MSGKPIVGSMYLARASSCHAKHALGLVAMAQYIGCVPVVDPFRMDLILRTAEGVDGGAWFPSAQVREGHEKYWLEDTSMLEARP